MEKTPTPTYTLPITFESKEDAVATLRDGVLIRKSALLQIRQLAEKHGILEELQALNVEATPLEWD